MHVSGMRLRYQTNRGTRLSTAEGGSLRAPKAWSLNGGSGGPPPGKFWNRSSQMRSESISWKKSRSVWMDFLTFKIATFTNLNLSSYAFRRCIDVRNPLLLYREHRMAKNKAWLNRIKIQKRWDFSYYYFCHSGLHNFLTSTVLHAGELIKFMNGFPNKVTLLRISGNRGWLRAHLFLVVRLD